MEPTFEELLNLFRALVSVYGIQVIYSVYTGHPNKALPKIKRRITRLINGEGYLEIYVGRTSFPEKEIARYAGEFDMAMVVYKTTSPRYAHAVESELIRYYTESILVDVLNENDIDIDKADDHRRDTEKPPYYVYVLFR